MMAPSAGNRQAWHLITLPEREKLDRVPSFRPYNKMVLRQSATSQGL
jgi:nitroreductase